MELVLPYKIPFLYFPCVARSKLDMKSKKQNIAKIFHENSFLAWAFQTLFTTDIQRVLAVTVTQAQQNDEYLMMLNTYTHPHPTLDRPLCKTLPISNITLIVLTLDEEWRVDKIEPDATPCTGYNRIQGFRVFDTLATVFQTFRILVQDN